MTLSTLLTASQIEAAKAQAQTNANNATTAIGSITFVFFAEEKGLGPFKTSGILMSKENFK
jgi:hypothetical protein